VTSLSDLTQWPHSQYRKATMFWQHKKRLLCETFRLLQPTTAGTVHSAVSYHSVTGESRPAVV